MATDLINSANVESLIRTVEEAARSTEEGVKHFIEPAQGTLSRAQSRRHHIVFGRRGSGKSSLLRKAAADLTIDRRPIAYINVESFKGHSYPDVLLSVLIQTRKHQMSKEQHFKELKIDFLHRHIIDYQNIFREMARVSHGDSFLFLDDLYHIRRSDQPNLIDYFHRIAKDHGLWLKIGTIRHRSDWYLHGDPPIGIKLGDDADQIDLDITLEKYAIAREFLHKILGTFAADAGVDLTQLMTVGALDRLVLASGGVARDSLSVFRASVNCARERLRSADQRYQNITAEDVNIAAGEYDQFKREEFKRDTSDDEESLQEQFQQIRNFCLDQTKANCFLLDKDAKGPEVGLIHELVDLKLFHLVRSRVTVSGQKGRIFEAYMLDLSQYAGARKRRDVDIVEFWRADAQESLRRRSLIYSRIA